jgi:hypothetical protein
MEDFGLFPSAPALLLRMEISTSVKSAAEPVRLRPELPTSLSAGKNSLEELWGQLNGPK